MVTWNMPATVQKYFLGIHICDKKAKQLNFSSILSEISTKDHTSLQLVTLYLKIIKIRVWNGYNFQSQWAGIKQLL